MSGGRKGSRCHLRGVEALCACWLNRQLSWPMGRCRGSLADHLECHGNRFQTKARPTQGGADMLTTCCPHLYSARLFIHNISFTNEGHLWAGGRASPSTIRGAWGLTDAPVKTVTGGNYSEEFIQSFSLLQKQNQGKWNRAVTVFVTYSSSDGQQLWALV